MSDRDSGEDLSRLVAELVTTLEDLEDELEPSDERPLRPPTPGELRRFTSDVAIPGLILILESNIRALRLLQRALRPSPEASTGNHVSFWSSEPYSWIGYITSAPWTLAIDRTPESQASSSPINSP